MRRIEATCPPSTVRVEVSYELADNTALLDRAFRLGAVVGHDWHPDCPYAYVFQKKIGGAWYAFLHWGEYDKVMFRASGPAFDAPPLDGLSEGEPFTFPKAAA
jgi:hypothetical protein